MYKAQEEQYITYTHQIHIMGAISTHTCKPIRWLHATNEIVNQQQRTHRQNGRANISQFGTLASTRLVN